MSIENRIEVNALQRSAMYLNRFGNLTCVRGEPFTELTLYKTGNGNLRSRDKFQKRVTHFCGFFAVYPAWAHRHTQSATCI